MFLCSNSSAVGLWLSRLRKKSRKSFWTISYPPWVINLRGPCRCMRQGARPFHPVLCKTASDHRRLSSSISTPGKAPCDTSRRADPPPSSRRRPLPSPAPPGPPGQGTLLVTEVPFSHVASLWDCGLCPPPPRRRRGLAACHVCADPVRTKRGSRPRGDARQRFLCAKNNRCSSSCPHPSPPEPP